MNEKDLRAKLENLTRLLKIVTNEGKHYWALAKTKHEEAKRMILWNYCVNHEEVFYDDIGIDIRYLNDEMLFDLSTIEFAIREVVRYVNKSKYYMTEGYRLVKQIDDIQALLESLA